MRVVMHKVRIVQKLTLPPVVRRLEAISEAGNKTFYFKNSRYLSGMSTIAASRMSDRQLAA
jgi:tryptophanase